MAAAENPQRRLGPFRLTQHSEVSDDELLEVNGVILCGQYRERLCIMWTRPLKCGSTAPGKLQFIVTSADDETAIEAWIDRVLNLHPTARVKRYDAPAG